MYLNSAWRARLQRGPGEGCPSLQKGDSRASQPAGSYGDHSYLPLTSLPAHLAPREPRQRPRPAHFRVCGCRVRNDVSVSCGPRKCNSNLFGARIPREKVITTARGSSLGELEGHASSRLPPQPCSWGQSSGRISVCGAVSSRPGPGRNQSRGLAWSSSGGGCWPQGQRLPRTTLRFPRTPLLCVLDPADGQSPSAFSTSLAGLDTCVPK